MLHQAALIRGEQIGGDDWQLAVAFLLEIRCVLIVLGMVVLPRASAVALVVALGDDTGPWGEDVRGCECGGRKDQSGEKCGDVHRGQLDNCVMTPANCVRNMKRVFDKWHGVLGLCCFPSTKTQLRLCPAKSKADGGLFFYASFMF